MGNPSWLGAVFNVLLVDRATFPSDTISTHILWPHGAEILARWGLLETLAATGLLPICRRMTFDVGPFALRGTIPDGNEGIGGFCPRRTVLDSFLVKAAAQCRAEVRESFTVDELLMTGGTVVRVRGQGNGGTAAEERARVIVGADGVNSFVARSVRAPEYDTRPVAACCYYSYFSGVPQDDIELYVREHCAFGGAPTNDGLHLVMVNWPARDFPVVRADVEKHVWRALEMAPDFLARVRDGRREEKWYGTAGVPGYVIFRIARPPARLRRRTTVFDARDNLGLKSRVGWSAGREGPGADHAAAAARWAGSEQMHRARTLTDATNEAESA